MNQEPQKNYLELKPKDAEKIQRHKAKQESGIKVDDTALLVAEFGMYYGYDAIKAVDNDEITLDRMLELVLAARKVDARHQYNAAAGVFTAVASANAKRPASAFKSNTRQYLREMRADA